MKTCRITGSLRPVTGRWRRADMPGNIQPGNTRVWFNLDQPLAVISSHQLANAPDGSGDVIRQWHLSATRRDEAGRPYQIEEHQLDLVVDCFGLSRWDIFNRPEGAEHHIWIPVNPARRGSRLAGNDPDGQAA